MTGTHKIEVTIQPVQEDPGLCVVDVKYIIMISGRNGYVSNSSWTCKAKDGLPVESIKEVLLAVCGWFTNKVDLLCSNNSEMAETSHERT